MIKLNPKHKFYSYLGKEDILQNNLLYYVKQTYNKSPMVCIPEKKRTPFEQYKFKAIGGDAGNPDVFYPYPMKGFCGLYIELKQNEVSVFDTKGNLVKATEKHHLKQYSKLMQHLTNGYFACFCSGISEAKDIVDWYFRPSRLLDKRR